MEKTTVGNKGAVLRCGSLPRCRYRRSTPCGKNWAGVSKLKRLYIDGKQKLNLFFQEKGEKICEFIVQWMEKNWVYLVDGAVSQLTPA